MSKSEILFGNLGLPGSITLFRDLLGNSRRKQWRSNPRSCNFRRQTLIFGQKLINTQTMAPNSKFRSLRQGTVLCDVANVESSSRRGGVGGEGRWRNRGRRKGRSGRRGEKEEEEAEEDDKKKEQEAEKKIRTVRREKRRMGVGRRRKERWWRRNGKWWVGRRRKMACVYV